MKNTFINGIYPTDTGWQVEFETKNFDSIKYVDLTPDELTEYIEDNSMNIIEDVEGNVKKVIRPDVYLEEELNDVVEAYIEDNHKRL